MHEGPTENRLGELGSLYKYYYYYYYYYFICRKVSLEKLKGRLINSCSRILVLFQTL